MCCSNVQGAAWAGPAFATKCRQPLQTSVTHLEALIAVAQVIISLINICCTIVAACKANTNGLRQRHLQILALSAKLCLAVLQCTGHELDMHAKVKVYFIRRGGCQWLGINGTHS